MTALKLRLVGRRSDQPLFKWQTTNAEAKRVSEGLRVAANTHIEPEIDMIQIINVSN